MGVKGLRYQDTTKIDNRINSKLSYQQCSGRQEKSFQEYYLFFVHRVCLEERMFRSKPSVFLQALQKARLYHSCGGWKVSGEGKSLLSLRTMRGKGLGPSVTLVMKCNCKCQPDARVKSSLWKFWPKDVTDSLYNSLLFIFPTRKGLPSNIFNRSKYGKILSHIEYAGAKLYLNFFSQILHSSTNDDLWILLRYKLSRPDGLAVDS